MKNKVKLLSTRSLK